MRQIATLPERDARKLADYLLTLGINTQLLEDGGSQAVWVCDEDQVSKARSELAEFVKDPSGPRYAAASRAAEEIRQREEQEEDAFQERQATLEKRMRRGSNARPIVTLALVLASIGASLLSGSAFLMNGGLGHVLGNPVFQALVISSSERGLSQVEEGQLWRLVTPIFLHFGPIHLLFALLMLHGLGGAVEARRGSPRMLALVLVIAVCSNLGQFYWGPPAKAVDGTVLGYNPLFGGMSGVLYGLFGYAWMKGRFAPELGLAVPPNMVAFLIGWFFLCLIGVIGHVANVAHGVGLVLGMAIGVAPHLLSRGRGD